MHSYYSSVSTKSKFGQLVGFKDKHVSTFRYSDIQMEFFFSEKVFLLCWLEYHCSSFSLSSGLPCSLQTMTDNSEHSPQRELQGLCTKAKTCTQPDSAIRVISLFETTIRKLDCWQRLSPLPCSGLPIENYNYLWLPRRITNHYLIHTTEKKQHFNFYSSQRGSF